MMDISFDQMKMQSGQILDLSDKPSIIYFDDFVKSLSPLYKRGNMPDEIRVAKNEDALLAKDYEPAFIINVKDNLDLLDYQGMPMWHNTSNDRLSLHGLGLIEGNKATPSEFAVYSTNPHIYLGGATGHGKSVIANDLIMSICLAHPPWLVQLFLSDPKITEMKPYAIANSIMPHVNAVSATSDPEYGISILEYVNSLMSKRASIFADFQVKDIDGFNKHSGLFMPMLVVILDELRSMLMTAGKRASHVDFLIGEFVTKARFCGGRCLALSQGVVSELSQATMANINIRAALGCIPADSEKLIGNPGAAVNLGQIGRVVYNDSALKTLKENVHLVAPFLPDRANENSNSLYEIFDHQKKVWEELTHPGARISPLSFFDEEAKLTKEQFKKEIEGKVSMDRIFIGEPAYINKTEYPMASISLNPIDQYSNNLSNNILFLTPYAKHRLNFLATLLLNFDELRKTTDIDVRVYTDLKYTINQIKKFGSTVDGFGESTTVEGDFSRIVQQTYARILMIKVDELIFSDEGKEPEENELYERILSKIEEYTGRLSSLMKRRIRVFLTLSQDVTARMIFGLSDILKDRADSIKEYYPLVETLPFAYEDFNCSYSQLTTKVMPVDIRIFHDFGSLAGAEVKPNRMLETWMGVVRQAPVYGVHFIIISDMLPNCGSNLNGIFNKILFYSPTTNAIGQHKLADDFPPTTLDCLYIYADKTLTKDKCVKVKYVEMLD